MLNGTGLLVGSIGDNTNITSSSYETSESRKEPNNVVYEANYKSKVTWGENYYSSDINNSFFNLKSMEFFQSQTSASDAGKSLNSYDIKLKGDITGTLSSDNNPQLNLTGTYKDYTISVNLQQLNGTALAQSVRYSFSFSSKDGLSFNAALVGNISSRLENQYDGAIDKLNISYEVIGEGIESKFSYVSTESNTELADALNQVEINEFRNAPAGLSVLEALLIGNDKITGTLGQDNLIGFAGNDSIMSLDGEDYIDGGEGKDTLNGGDGADYIFGGLGNDSAIGGNGEDYIDGDLGNDNLLGGLGIDTLWGNAGVDTLNGGDDTDFIAGGQGRDSLTGGSGADFFVFNSKSITDGVAVLAYETGDGDSGISLSNMDKIADFKSGEDKIVIYIRDFATNWNPPREIGTFNLVEDTAVSRSLHHALTKANAFFKSDAELAQDNLFYAYDSKNGYVFVDSDNNGLTDMAIQLVGINNPSKITSDDVQVSIGQFPLPL
jgi:Ca2+-binding RTX toxin-like protein